MFIDGGGCYGIAFNGSLWVAVGDGFCYSTNLWTWNAINRASLFTNTGQAIAWNGSMFVAGGDRGSGTSSIAYSTNGITWTSSNPTPLTYRCSSIACNSSMWIAVGYGSGAGPAVGAYSTNGITWTEIGFYNIINTSLGNCILSVVWNGTIWIILSYGTYKIAWSIDGLNWYGVNTTAVLQNNGYNYAIAWNGSMFVGISGFSAGQLGYSTNGTNWTAVSGVTIGQSNCAIAWTGSMWIITGTNATTAIFYSTNGTSWTGVSGTNTNRYWFRTISVYNYPVLPANPVTVTPPALPYTLNSSTLITHGYSGTSWPNSKISISNDGGTTWASFGTGDIFSGTNITPIAYNGILYTTGVYYSYNLSSWRLCHGAMSSGSLIHIVYNGSYFVATRGGATYYSSDGINWSLQRSASGTPAGLSWNGTTWISASTSNGLAYSTNGTTWTSITMPTIMGQIYAIGSNATMTILAGLNTASSGQAACYSTNLTTWTSITFPSYFNLQSISASNSQNTSIVWNGSMWVMTGQGSHNGSNYIQSIIYSTNGITWSSISNGQIFSKPYGNLCWTGSKWICTQYMSNDTTPGLAYSSNGTSWTEISLTVGSIGALRYIRQNVQG